MYPGVELRLLRYVVGVADELHFSRAAAKLHVAQPSLSKQIRGLEEELGIQLFERTKREVRLTEAGKIFVQEARIALLHSHRAVHLAKASRDPNRFALGYSPYVDFDLLSCIRSLASSRFSSIKLSFVSSFTHEQVDLVHRGQLDAGLVILPAEHRGLAVQNIKREPLLAALPMNHGLCRQKTLQLQDLNGTPLIVVSRQWHPQFYKRSTEICASAGYAPHVVQKVRTELEAIHMVAEGLGFTFARLCFERLKCPGVAFRPIKGWPLAVETGLVYRAGQQSALLTALLESLIGKRRPQRADAAARLGAVS
jgi:DNA-binding transcriptional LysR family regulator